MRLTYLLVLVLMIVPISQAKVNNEVTFSDFALNAGDSIEIGSYTIEMVEVQSISDGIVVVRATKAGGVQDEERALLENSANSFDGGSDNGGITVTVVAIFDEQSAKIRVEYPKDLGIPKKSTSNRSLRGVEIDKAASKEVAYVYDEGGGHELKNVTAHSGTDVIAYTVSLGEGSSSTSSKISTTGDAIKIDITRKINKLNRPIIKEGSKLIGNISGDRRIDQICSIYEYSVSNWIYKADWTGSEYFQYSNESLEYGQDVNKQGKGDCDDFSIFLAALIESVGGTPRIIFAYGPAGGHAFAQVYLGVGYDSKVSRMVDWLKSKYGVKEVYTFKDEATEDVWLNLDWWKDPKTSKDVVKHPGGPLFNATDFVYAYQDDRENWTALTPVPMPPIAKFSISNANPNAGENVTFDASESSDVDTMIKAWNWDFGDGKRDSGKSVNHAYSKGGRYNVTLTVTDDDEVEKSSRSNKTIDINELPVPIMTYKPKDPKLGDSIDFDASRSYDLDIGGMIKKYYWEFGDGEDSRKMQSSYRYDTNGSYTVSLTVEDNKGAKNTTSLKLKVNLPPKAIMRIEPPQQPSQLHNNGDEVKFDASSSLDPDGSIEKWYWDFGDGTNSSAEQASHIYAKGGEYPVKLNVTDENNASSETAKILKVNARPMANFTFTPSNPQIDEEIKFDASASNDPNGRIEKYEWNFADKREDWFVSYASHKYLRIGEYKITLTVTDDTGATNSSWANIKVSELNQKPVFHDFKPDKQSPQAAGTKIIWSVNASDPEKDNLTYKFFLKGPSTNGQLSNRTEWTADPTWIWNTNSTDAGTSQVEVWIRDGKHADADHYDDRAIRYFDISIERYPTAPVNNSPPIAKISYDIAEPTVEDAIVFDGSDSYDIDGTISRFFWDFEDESNILHGPHQAHKFRECGSTKVSLTVFDNENASNSTTVELMIYRSNPKQKFSLSHDHRVVSVVFSHDASKVVTASDDNTAHIFNVSSGQELSKLLSSGQELHKLPHDGQVYRVAFSPDGKTVVTASYDKTARLWDVSSGQELHKLPHGDSVISVAFSPDGKTVATASYDKTARLWDVSSGQELHKLPHDGVVESVAFSPDGKTVATASSDKTARLWDD